MALPRVLPVNPTRRKQPFDHPDWLFDVKYDGFRALCYVEQGPGHFMSRNGHDFPRFTAFGNQVGAALKARDAVLDGEIIAPDMTGRPRFWDLLRGARALAYVAFDLLWLDGVDLRPLPLSERRQALHGLLPEASPVLSEALSVEGRGCRLYELVRAHDLEGIVAKRLADPYDLRTRWLKIKNPDYSQKEGRAELFNKSGWTARGSAR